MSSCWNAPTASTGASAVRSSRKWRARRSVLAASVLAAGNSGRPVAKRHSRDHPDLVARRGHRDLTGTGRRIEPQQRGGARAAGLSKHEESAALGGNDRADVAGAAGNRDRGGRPLAEAGDV